MGESDPCTRCGHPFDPHVMKSACLASLAPGDPEVPVAGWMECPVEGCDCWSTWAIAHEDLPPGITAIIDQYLTGLRRVRALGR